jgi:DNA-binding transcriptional regulator YiaG
MNVLTLILTPPEVRGADLKSYRQKCLRMSINAFAARFGTSRQNVAHLERLERPLTKDEVLSIDPTKSASARQMLLRLAAR